MTDPYAIRLARTSELPRLTEIEDDAGEMYGEVEIDPDLPGLSREVLARGVDERLLWVVADASDAPVAFALCWRYPEALHLRELDVHPEHMRRGLGRRLIEHVRGEAHAAGLPRLTLTTFTNVPWNAPLYRRYGFERMERDAMPPWLQAIRDEEDAGPLRAWPRCAMALRTGPG